PVSVQVLSPVLIKVLKPRYCADAPMVETSKLLLIAPPRRRVPALVASTTLPLMVLPACNSSTLVPPVNEIALARVEPSPDTPPEIVPLLMIVRLEPTTPSPPAPGAPAIPPPTAAPAAPPLPPVIVPAFVSVAPLAVNWTPTPPSPPSPA